MSMMFISSSKNSQRLIQFLGRESRGLNVSLSVSSIGKLLGKRALINHSSYMKYYF